MRRTLILSAIVLLLIATSLGYFFWIRPGQAETNRAKEVSAAVNEPRPNLIAAPGVVEGISEEIEIGAEIGGKIKEVTVEEGDSVERGQTIAVLENADFEANVKTARTGIEILRRQQEIARARLVQAQADKTRIVNGARPQERRESAAEFETTVPVVENARREAERRRKLYEAGDVSREEFERANRDLRIAEARSKELRERFNTINADARGDDVEKADAAIRLANAQIREFDALVKEANAKIVEAETRLTKTIVRAPISGVILRKRMNAGETFAPENPNGIVTIADVSALRVRTDVDETDVAKIRVGQPTYVTAETYGARKFYGKVIKIGQILGRKNIRTDAPNERIDKKILEVLIELEPNQKLPLGLRVDAFVTIEQQKEN